MICGSIAGFVFYRRYKGSKESNDVVIGSLFDSDEEEMRADVEEETGTDNEASSTDENQTNETTSSSIKHLRIDFFIRLPQRKVSFCCAFEHFEEV